MINLFILILFFKRKERKVFLCNSTFLSLQSRFTYIIVTLNCTQPDLSGALFVIAIAEKFNLLSQFLRNDKKAGTLRLGSG